MQQHKMSLTEIIELMLRICRDGFMSSKQENPLGPVVADLENTLTAKRWFDHEISAPQTSGMGGGLLTWALDRRERMGHRLFLCRHLSENDMNVHNIGL